jgi:hypothetical protein
VSTTPKFGDEEAKLQVSILRAQNADLKAQRDHYSQLNIEQCADLIAKDGDIDDLRARVELLGKGLTEARALLFDARNRLLDLEGSYGAVSEACDEFIEDGPSAEDPTDARAALTPKGGETEGCPECGGTDHDGRSHKP